MKLLRHEMAGFNHFDGPFALDLRQLPDGVIAIVGDNGAGKTSIALEGPLVGLYGPGERTQAFPSREGPLASYATSRAAYIDDLWELGGVLYRTRVNVDGSSRTTDAVLQRAGVPLNDGKTTTYRQAVARLFPPRRSMLASAFAGQTRRGSFGDLSQADRVALFRELADLEHLEQKATLAKELALLPQQLVTELRATIGALASQKPDEIVRQCAETAAQAAAALADATRRRQTAAALIETAQAAASHWQESATEHALALAAVAAAAGRTADVTIELAELKSPSLAERHAEQAIEKTRQRHASAVDYADRARTTAREQADAERADLQERLDNNRKVLKDRGSIETAAQHLRQLEGEHRLLASQLASKVSVADAARVTVAEARDRVSEMQRLGQQHAERTRRAGLLSKVKFGDSCAEDPACPLVADAAAAKREAVELALRFSPAAEAELLAAVGHAEARLAQLNQQAADDRKRLQEIDAELQKPSTERARQLAAALQHADERIGDLEKQLQAVQERLDLRLKAIDESVAVADAKLQEELQGAQEDLTAARQERLDRVDDLNAELKALAAKAAVNREACERTANAAEMLARAEADAAAATTAFVDAAGQIAAAQASLETAEAGRAAAECVARQLATARVKLATAEEEMLSWQVLARALGRDGLQRLEIDAAGPVVSDLANDLLSVGYGTRFSVRIVTQVATADGKDLKEKFTIEVVDNEHDAETRDISDLSGGERVIVDEAIRAALAAYVNIRSQTRCRTIWRDETTGALAPKNVAPYVTMLRRLRELSGADQVLFITHSEQAAALADAVVDVVNGTASIRGMEAA